MNTSASKYQDAEQEARANKPFYPILVHVDVVGSDVFQFGSCNFHDADRSVHRMRKGSREGNTEMSDCGELATLAKDLL